MLRPWFRQVSAAYQPTIDGLRTDAKDPKDALTKGGQKLVQQKLPGILDGAAQRVERHAKSEFKRLGIKLRETEPRFDKLISDWRTENLSRVTGLVEDEMTKLSEIMTASEGRHPESVAKDLEERLGITSRKAELIARDQMLTLNSQISTERAKASGITRARWTTANDDRVRDSHEEVDGEEFDLDEGLEVDGEKVLPGEPINCRCTSEYLIAGVDYEDDEAA